VQKEPGAGPFLASRLAGRIGLVRCSWALNALDGSWQDSFPQHRPVRMQEIQLGWVPLDAQQIFAVQGKERGALQSGARDALALLLRA
jgi:hypothetical protein